MENKQRIATLTLDDGRSIELPILSGTLGPDVVDVRAINKLGVFTYDPSFTATASCTSTITFIDGDAGLLYYRGYPIEQLAEKSEFLEVCYLLKFGELPNAEQKAAFMQKVTKHTMVHDQLNRFYNGFRRDAHPMAVTEVGVRAADTVDFRSSQARCLSARTLSQALPAALAASSSALASSSAIRSAS